MTFEVSFNPKILAVSSEIPIPPDFPRGERRRFYGIVKM